MQLPHHSNIPRLARDGQIFGPSAVLNRDPTLVTSVNNTFQTVPQPSVPQQSATSEHPCLVSWSGQLQEQGFSVEVTERIAVPQRPSIRAYQSSVPCLKMVQKKSVVSSISSQKHVSDFFMYLYQPTDGYRMAITDNLGPMGCIFLKAPTLTGYFLAFTGIVPKVPGNFLSGSLLLYLMTSQKLPLSL